MALDQPSVRFPWVACALSFLSSGVGHIYCGRITKGLFLYSSRFFLPLLHVIAAFLQPTTGIFIVLLLLPALGTVLVFLYSPFDAYFIAKRTGADYKLKEYNRTSLYWLLILMQFAYPVALVFGTREYVYEAFYIPERSMSPTCLAGDRILVNKRPFQNSFPQRGDVVAFRTPSSEVGRTWIKRVIGVAGDRVVIKGREIEVNGKKLERERIPADSILDIREQVEGDAFYESLGGRRYRIQYSNPPVTNVSNAKEPVHENDDDEFAAKEIDVVVPDRSIFVMGDNRDLSKDSRHIGSIHVGDVVGFIDYIFYPAETWSRLGVYRD